GFVIGDLRLVILTLVLLPLQVTISNHNSQIHNSHNHKSPFTIHKSLELLKFSCCLAPPQPRPRAVSSCWIPCPLSFAPITLWRGNGPCPPRPAFPQQPPMCS